MSSIISRIFVALWFFTITIPAISGSTPGGENGPTEKSLAIARSIALVNSDLEKKNDKAIIFLGNNGVGKSTLASKVLGEELVAKYLEETGNVVIVSKAEKPAFDIKGQELFDDDSKTIITPVRAELSEKIAIWDIPGFSENDQQKTFISYCLERILANSKEVKIVFVTSDSSLNDRGALFFTAIQHLTSLVNTDKLEKIGKGLLLVITHIPKMRTVEQVRTQLTNLGKNLPDGQAKTIFDALISNISLFARAEVSQIEEENIINSDITDAVLVDTFPATISFLKSNISPEAKTVCEELCVQSMHKLTDISTTLIETLKNPWLSSQQGKDPLCLNNYCFAQPASQLVQKDYHDSEEDFVKINQMRELLALIENAKTEGMTIDTAVILLRDILNTLETYVVIDNICDQNMAQALRLKLQQFNQEANQQMIYAQTFADFSQRQEMLHSLAEKIITSIKQTKDSLIIMSRNQINDFIPDCEQTDPDYFREAITLLNDAEKCPSTNERQSKCHEMIGNIYKKDGKFREAGEAYVNALQLHAKNDQCHRSLAKVLRSLGRFELAIVIYQTILDTVKLEKCSEEIIAHHRTDWQQRQSLGNAWYRAGNFDKALENYQAVVSLMPSEQKKQKLEFISQLLKSGREQMAVEYAEKINGDLALSNEDLEAILREIKETK